MLPDRTFNLWLLATWRSDKALRRCHPTSHGVGYGSDRFADVPDLRGADNDRPAEAQQHKSEGDELREVPAVQDRSSRSSDSQEPDNLIHRPSTFSCAHFLGAQSV